MALVVERGTELRCIGDAKGTGIQGRRLGAAAGHLQRRVTNKSGPHTIQVWGQLSDGDGSATTVIAEWLAVVVGPSVKCEKQVHGNTEFLCSEITGKDLQMAFCPGRLEEGYRD